MALTGLPCFKHPKYMRLHNRNERATSQTSIPLQVDVLVTGITCRLGMQSLAYCRCLQGVMLY